MKKYLTLITIFVTLISVAESDSWKTFEKSWDAYIAESTHENALKVYRQLPNEPLVKDLPDQRLMDKLYEDWPHINQKIKEQNKDVIEIGFKLYAIADGGFKEDIGADLGKLITKNSVLFLQELKKHRALVQNLEGIVCNYGEEYVDDKEGQMLEMDNRMRLLVNVNDPELEEVKAECLKVLMRTNADKVVDK